MKDFFSKNNLALPEGFLEATAQVARSTLKTEVISVDSANDMVHVPGYGVVKKHQAESEAHLASALAHEHLSKGNYSHAAIQHERAAMFGRALHAHNSAKEHVAEETQLDEAKNIHEQPPHIQQLERMKSGFANHSKQHQFAVLAGNHEKADKHHELMDHYGRAVRHIQKTNTIYTGQKLSEELQQLDELSKKTLGSYANKASNALQYHANQQGLSAAVSKDVYKHHGEKSKKRLRGLQTAVGKLAKEEGQVEGTVTEDQQEPHVGRVQDKYRREMARKMKNKDKEKKEGKEGKYK
jgi:hypothetical protein